MNIHIHYAYDGFLYAPLFLAKRLKLLPESFVLTKADNDEDAISKFRQLSTDNEKHWFAICDPFAVNLHKIRDLNTGAHPRIVGTIIDKPALWAYHPSAIVQPATFESDLKQYKNQAIKSLVCYESGSTGFVFGKRLQQAIDLPNNKLVELSLANEYADRGNLIMDNTTLLLTADALFLAKEALIPNKQDIVLHYPRLAAIGNKGHQPHPDLTPFLFTAVITWDTVVIEKNLWAVVTLLNAIKYSINILSNGQMPNEIADHLLVQYTTHLDNLEVTNQNERRQIIETAANFTFQDQNQRICPLDPRPSIESAEKALKQWRLYGDGHGDDLKHLIDEGPSLLIHDEWQYQVDIHHYLARRDPKLFQAFASKCIPKRFKWYMGISIVFAFIAFYWISEKITTVILAGGFLASPMKISVTLTAIISYIVFLGSIKDCLRRLRDGDFEYYTEVLGFGTAIGFATLISVLGFLNP